MITMKKLKLILAGIFFLFLSLGIMAQGPPNPPGDHGSGDDEPPGGGAPIGSGTFLLIGMVLTYGGKRVYDLKKKES